MPFLIMGLSALIWGRVRIWEQLEFAAVLENYRHRSWIRMQSWQPSFCVWIVHILSMALTDSGLPGSLSQLQPLGCWSHPLPRTVQFSSGHSEQWYHDQVQLLTALSVFRTKAERRTAWPKFRNQCTAFPCRLLDLDKSHQSRDIAASTFSGDGEA